MQIQRKRELKMLQWFYERWRQDNPNVYKFGTVDTKDVFTTTEVEQALSRLTRKAGAK